MGEVADLWASVGILNRTAVAVVIKAGSSSCLKDNRDATCTIDAGVETCAEYVCLELVHANGKATESLFLDSQWEGVTEMSFSSGDFVNALSRGDLWVDVKLPKTGDTPGTCTGPEYKHTVDVVPNTGRPVEVVLPVAPSMIYGDVYWWPVTPLTQACFESNINCDRAIGMSDREVVSGASCSGDSCSFQRKRVGGYYQVSSRNNLPIIVAVSVSCVLMAGAFIGSALYFRRNPEKWDSVKLWGPTKYKLIKRSLAGQV